MVVIILGTLHLEGKSNYLKEVLNRTEIANKFLLYWFKNAELF